MATRKTTLRDLALICVALTTPTASMAIGLGANVGYSYRTGTPDQGQTDALENGFPLSIDWSSNDVRVGLTLDTAVARDRLFNYRLNVDYQRSWVTVSGLPQTINYDGGELENIFGFGIVRKPEMRWWVGPALRLAGGSGLVTVNTPTSIFIRDATQVEVGPGIVTGINLHRGDRFSVGMTAGYYVNWAVFNINDVGPNLVTPVPGSTVDAQYTGALHRFSVGMQVLYRVGGDSF